MRRSLTLGVVLLALHLTLVPAWTKDESTAAERTAELRADLLGHDSATQVLTQWCAKLGLASPSVVRAVRVRGVDKTLDAKLRTLLMARADEAIRYRRVRLTCGDHMLSEADNWYLPDRLTADMNRKLDETDTPFGAVVRPLGFHRKTLAVTPLTGTHVILRVRALLVTESGVPFSLVVETYSRDLIANKPPRL